ncbi:MAG: c-type cytochrome [Pirellulaceae bacterium]
MIPHVVSLEDGGRSFEAGKQLFRNAACIQCHRFANRGGILGPDITGSAKRYSMAVMLREIIDPSIQVSDQFENHVIITDEGKLLEGRILSESDETVTLAVDPRQPESILQIPSGSIEAKKVSRTSLMPKGLLNTLTREEILDLLAYILSAGDSEHDVFK